MTYYYDDRNIETKNKYTTEDWHAVFNNLTTLDLDSFKSGVLKFSTDFTNREETQEI
jgi:hypothetical protein